MISNLSTLINEFIYNWKFLMNLKAPYLCKNTMIKFKFYKSYSFPIKKQKMTQ